MINVTGKSIAKDVIKDRFGQVILEGKQFLRGNYLKKTCSKRISKVKFYMLQWHVFITPGEVFETFVGIDKDFTMTKDTYEIMVNNEINI